MNEVILYPDICSEVYEVLKKLPDSQIKLIPKEVIGNIYQNAKKSNREYHLQTDAMCRVILSTPAKAMIVALYSKYFLEQETNEILKQKLRENEQKREALKKQNYSNVQDIFYHPEQKKVTETQDKTELVVVEEKQSFWKKLINKIKNFLKKDKT